MTQLSGVRLSIQNAFSYPRIPSGSLQTRLHKCATERRCMWACLKRFRRFSRKRLGKTGVKADRDKIEFRGKVKT